jgi:hypothetical protein
MGQLDVNTPQDNILYLSTALAVFDGSGSPEGIENGALGSLYCDKATGNWYQKTTALGTLTGWTLFSGGGGGTPGGSDTQIQFNDAGSFGGDDDFTWNKITKLLMLGAGSAGGSIGWTAANGFITLITGPAVPTESESYALPITPPTITGEFLFVSSKGLNTQFGFSSNLTYDPVGRLSIDVTQNQSAYATVNNASSGNAAQSRLAVTANVSGGAIAAYSSGFTTSGLRVANSVVLDLDGPNAVILGQTAGVIQFGLGTTEYARLNTTRFGVLSLGLGASPSSLDVLLERDAANTLAQRNGANAQTFRIYNTYTDASNFSRLNISYGAFGDDIFITTSASGTGSAGAIQFGTNNTSRWIINTSGDLLTGADNTYDIGASGATRPRNIYLANNIFGNNSNSASTGFLQYVCTYNGYIGWAGRSYLQSPSDGVIFLQNSAGTDFTRLQFGGTTSSFPAIGRSGASIVFQLADGTLQTPILPINTNQLQFGGADAASPGAISLRVQNVVAGTSNTSGQNLSIFGSAGTGNAVGGAILLRVAPAGSSGTSQNASVVGLAIDGTARIYGSALHNNAAGMSGATNQYIGSGTYSPTITAVANCTVTTPGVNFKYLRVGNVVHVTGQLSIDPTTASTLTRARIALPISSNLSGTVGCQGTGNCGDVFGLGGAIFPDTTNDEAELNFICESGTPANNVWCVSFSYEVA